MPSGWIGDEHMGHNRLDQGKVQSDLSEPGQEGEYYLLPEEALHLLPEEWRNTFQSMADNGRAALEAVQKELPGEEGLRDMKLMEAIYKSADQRELHPVPKTPS
jgi:predicted dehydrogenase